MWHSAVTYFEIQSNLCLNCYTWLLLLLFWNLAEQTPGLHQLWFICNNTKWPLISMHSIYGISLLTWWGLKICLCFEVFPLFMLITTQSSISAQRYVSIKRRWLARHTRNDYSTDWVYFQLLDFWLGSKLSTDWPFLNFKAAKTINKHRPSLHCLRRLNILFQSCTPRFMS